MMKILKKSLLLFPFLFFFSGCSDSNPEQSQVQDLKNRQSSGEIVIEKNNIDMGEIPIMGGEINIPFSFRNSGNEPIVLLEGETSCMCTEAVVESNEGVISPRIKMRGHGGAQAVVNQVLQPGESATLLAVYNPLAHGPNATGPIKRDVFINTNSKITPKIRFSFRGKVIKGEKKEEKTNAKKMQKSSMPFRFSEDSFDFGVIKQSGGKVSHDFRFTYNGKEPITITGVPTSCACTTAKVIPTTMQPGKSGVLSVQFNPNLHDEPEGRFFKTASLLTEPPLSKIPEVKIWTEIDLDLGREAFELKDEHTDANDADEEKKKQYHSVTPEVFDAMLQNKDFFLIDTHIPEQKHIAKTDAFIPYNTLLESSDLPKDKSTKIVLYCRSGSMSRAAAYQLAEKGYTNVYDLVGGKIAYDNFLNQ